YDQVLERFVAGVKALRVGPAEENAEVAAVINQRQFEKEHGYIETGKDEARLAAGIGRAEAAGPAYYAQPTAVADVPPSATMACEEIFGPVVAVMKAKDIDQALTYANATTYALTGGLISRDRSRLERARREFRVGNLYLNRKITGALVGVQPFGGF